MTRLRQGYGGRVVERRRRLGTETPRHRDGRTWTNKDAERAGGEGGERGAEVEGRKSRVESWGRNMNVAATGRALERR